jgi:hypothetical protein
MKKPLKHTYWVQNHQIIAILALITTSIVVVIITTNILHKYPISTPPYQSTTSESITLKGTLTCLPHRNASGPQTLECAIGFKSDQGVYYSLAGQNRPITATPFGKTVEVTGRLKHQESKLYQSSGVITVEHLEIL